MPCRVWYSLKIKLSAFKAETSTKYGVTFWTDVHTKIRRMVMLPDYWRCFDSNTVYTMACNPHTEPTGLTPNPMDINPVMIAVRLPFLS